MTRMEYKFTGHIENYNTCDREHDWECDALTPDREIAFEINVADDIADELVRWQSDFSNWKVTYDDIPDHISRMLIMVWNIAEAQIMLSEGYDGRKTNELWASVDLGYMRGELEVVGDRLNARITTMA